MPFKDFILFASPWWVNLLILMPLISFYFWYRRRLVITLRQLLYAALFAAAFGFVEAAVVDYLHGNIDKQNGPTDGRDAGSKFDAVAMRTQVAF